MENWRNKIILPVLLLLLSSCDEFEFRGFVTSYESVNQRFEQSDEWNRVNGYTEINVEEETYTLNAMGDSHVGSTKNLDYFFNKSMEENTAAVVMVGDITTGHEDDYHVFEEHLPPKDSLLYFAVPGNHDLFFNGWKSFYSIFGPSVYYFVINTPSHSDLFICLDTGGGTLGNKQLEWFKKLLETERSNYRYCTVFTHNNLFRLRPTASTNPMVEEIRVLIDLFTKYKINMVVTGHDHLRNTAVLGNTSHIIMDALQDSNQAASYLQLSISEEDIGFSFKPIP